MTECKGKKIISSSSPAKRLERGSTLSEAKSQIARFLRIRKRFVPNAAKSLSG
jgi:hypothetical protein